MRSILPITIPLFIMMFLTNQYSWSSVDTIVGMSHEKNSQNRISVNTALGSLIGTLDNRIATFLGVPYASPPVALQRWQPAKPVNPWVTPKAALSFSPACMQAEDHNWESIYFHTPFNMSEDCLYLNIWAPTPIKQTKKPVMVWIHGGGLVAGTASSDFYSGKKLALRDVVVVTFNYRLGAFGYLSHPELTKESTYRSSGNYGVTDQLQVLKWVKQHIAAFGGDPDNITIFGQSAGALSVSHLLVSPLAEGLFHKAILQSPYLPHIPELSLSSSGRMAAERNGEILAEQAGVKSLAELRELSPESILSASEGLEFDKVARDGWVFKEQIYTVFAEYRQHKVPVLLGFNLDEGSHYPFFGIVKPPTTPEQYIKLAEKKYGTNSSDFLTLYPPTDLATSSYRSVGHALHGWAVERIARSMASVGKDVFFYTFEHIHPLAEKQGYGAFHGAEIPYVFDSIDTPVNHSLPNWPLAKVRSQDARMAETISEYWVSFAYNGHPGKVTLPEWKPYSLEQKNFIRFANGNAIPEVNPYSGLYELQQTIVEQRIANNQHWSWLNIGLLSPDIKPDRTKENSARWDRVIKEKINMGDLSHIDTTYHDNYTYYGMGDMRVSLSEGRARELMKRAISEFRSGFSDLHITNRIFSDVGQAANHFVIEGTHDGEWLGIAATGNRIRVKGIAVVRFEENQVVEEYELWDEISLLKQLGVIKDDQKSSSILQILRGVKSGEVEYVE